MRVATLADLEERLRKPGRPVMLDFYADWCVSCKEMEAFTFSDPRVRGQLDTMLLLQADVTKGNDADRALLKRFSLFGPPGIIFFDAQGQEIKGLRVIGYQDADRFLNTLSTLRAP
jgi:thiol:disulfide interchange protein DsbD